MTINDIDQRFIDLETKLKVLQAIVRDQGTVITQSTQLINAQSEAIHLLVLEVKERSQ